MTIDCLNLESNRSSNLLLDSHVGPALLTVSSLLVTCVSQLGFGNEKQSIQKCDEKSGWVPPWGRSPCNPNLKPQLICDALTACCDQETHSHGALLAFFRNVSIQFYPTHVQTENSGDNY